MHISWHGHYSIKLQTGETTIVLDPHSPETGLTLFRAKANVVALSNPADAAMSHLAGMQGEPTVFNSPGEYAMNGFTLHALGWHDQAGNEKSLQRWQIEDIVLLHVGALDRELSLPEMQELEKTNIDVLFVPVGGGTGLSLKGALALVSSIEPRVVIPIHYYLPGSKEKLERVEQFAKEMGVDPKAREQKVILKRKNIPQDELATLLLMP